MSKILKFARNFNKPIVRFLITRGWYLRLLHKRINKSQYKFRKLNSQQKKEIRSYWKRFGKVVSPDWCAYFSYASGIIDKRYIPESLYYGEILPSINSQVLGPGLADKNIQSTIFDTLMPEVIFHKVNGVFLNSKWEKIDIETAFILANNEATVVIKPASGSYGGAGVVFWTPENGKSNFKNIVSMGDNLIAQRLVKQHPFFESIHPCSLNTLRIVTLLVDDTPVVLSTILRMGQRGSRVDNYTAGGVICPVDTEGYLFTSAVQKDQSVVQKHPDGFVFQGKQIPFFQKIIDDAKKMHYRIPFFKMISWDYSLTPDGVPILIEGNYPTGQLDLHQLNIGPIFGEYTDHILSQVYGKPK